MLQGFEGPSSTHRSEEPRDLNEWAASGAFRRFGFRGGYEATFTTRGYLALILGGVERPGVFAMTSFAILFHDERGARRSLAHSIRHGFKHDAVRLPDPGLGDESFGFSEAHHEISGTHRSVKAVGYVWRIGNLELNLGALGDMPAEELLRYAQALNARVLSLA